MAALAKLLEKLSTKKIHTKGKHYHIYGINGILYFYSFANGNLVFCFNPCIVTYLKDNYFNSFATVLVILCISLLEHMVHL